ncbi:MAG: MerR family transcriptional regulator [Actinomycetota bacterium]
MILSTPEDLTVRISELSRASGLPVATIKYYIREDLLHAGRATAPNQADYDESHLRRLRLVRVMLELGELSVASARAVVAALGDDELPLHSLLGIAHHALGPDIKEDAPSDDVRRARADVDDYLERLGWRVSAGAPSRRALAGALVALRRLGRDADPAVFAPYARAADYLAPLELATIPPDLPRSDAIERVIVGTVVFEAALVALRRLAQEHHSARAGNSVT